MGSRSDDASVTEQTRLIGLSLGADICWPICFEALLKRLDPRIRVGDDTLRFALERITIEPFDLRQPCRYDVVLDRLTHWYYPSREWIKKAILLDGLYVLNNPWTLQAMEKHTSYCAMMRLGLNVPETWMLPPKEYEQSPDLEPTLQRYAQLFDLAELGKSLGYPLYMKPYAGGGWVGISRVEDVDELDDAYENSGKLLMHLQRAVEGYDLFVRCIGLGPQIRYVKYDPVAPLHDRYVMDADFLNESDKATLRRITLTINSFFGWDFNSAEILRKDGQFFPIDYANACPDSQVNSLHYHFPWLVKAKLRWALFCTATKRRFRMNLDWQPYFQVADSISDPEDKLRRYAEIAERHFETERFVEFCGRHLAALDEVAYEFFGSTECKDAVRQKIKAVYPENEQDEYTDLFFERIQRWREREGHDGVVLG